jgi:hypothetical protein
LYFGIAVALGLKRIAVHFLALQLTLRFVKLLEMIGQTFVDEGEQLFAHVGEFVDEGLVRITSTILVAPVDDPIAASARKALFEALEELAAFHQSRISVVQNCQTAFVHWFAGFDAFVGQIVENGVHSHDRDKEHG